MEADLRPFVTVKTVEQPMNDLEYQNTGRATVGPKNDNFAAWSNRPSELTKNLNNLVVGKVFDNPKVVGAIKSLRRDPIQMKDIAMADSFSVRIISAIGFERRQRN